MLSSFAEFRGQRGDVTWRGRGPGKRKSGQGKVMQRALSSAVSSAATAPPMHAHIPHGPF